MSGPDPGTFGTFGAVDAAAVPAVAAFEVADAAFAAGAPFDGAAERFSVFLGAARLGRSALARDYHVLDTEVGELLVDLGFAVAAVGGDRARVRPARLLTRFTVGASCGASGGLPCSTL